jgi:molybdenum-dependent DNA-binding transcriptional regulator ModE
LGEPLVETQPGKRGMKITQRARQLIKIFHTIDQKLQKTCAAIVEKSLNPDS